jgi:hypothetical protein
MRDGMKLNIINMKTIACLFCVAAFIGSSCTKEIINPDNDTFDPDYMAYLEPSNFEALVDNPYLPFIPGSTFTMIGESEDGAERTEVEVLTETKTILGIVCTVARDRVYINDQLVEDTYDWFAQDVDGNVWYMGEDVDNYVNGVIADHHGSWEAGVNGAEPGIVMLGSLVQGLHYRQEFLKGEAEDRGEIVGKNITVTVAAGTFTGCIKIRETTPLDKEFLEYKYYAPGVGVVKVEVVGDIVETEELSDYHIGG